MTYDGMELTAIQWRFSGSDELNDGVLIHSDDGDLIASGNLPEDAMEAQCLVSEATSEYTVENGVYVVG